MADYYLASWSRGVEAEAQCAGESATSITAVNLADAAITATLVNGDRVHFAQGSGNKKVFLELTSLLLQAAVPNSTWSLCRADSTPAAAGTNEEVLLTGGAFTTGTAARQTPSVADYVANTDVAATDTVKDYYLKVVATPGASPTGKIFVTLPVIPNTGIAPANAS